MKHYKLRGLFVCCIKMRAKYRQHSSKVEAEKLKTGELKSTRFIVYETRYKKCDGCLCSVTGSIRMCREKWQVRLGKCHKHDCLNM